jgi:hypothetical protein
LSRSRAAVPWFAAQKLEHTGASIAARSAQDPDKIIRIASLGPSALTK